MPRRLQLERAVGRQRRLDAVDRLARTARAPAARRARSPPRSSAAGRPARARNASVSASRMRRTSSASCSSSATMSLLISTVLSGSRNRLAPLVDAPCTMPGIAAAVLGLDDEHVAAVALGDDLILQVLRGVLAAQVRLERAAQPRALLAQPLANALQLRAGVVDDVAGRVDLLAHLRDLALERRGAAAGRFEQRERSAARAGSPARDSSTESRNAASASSRSGFERAPFDGQRVEDLRQIADARSGNSAVAPRDTAPFRSSPRAAARPSADRSTAASRASRSSPIGVSAKPRTASTMRSNSRARRAPGCIGGEPLIVSGTVSGEGLLG